MHCCRCCHFTDGKSIERCGTVWSPPQLAIDRTARSSHVHGAAQRSAVTREDDRNFWAEHPGPRQAGRGQDENQEIRPTTLERAAKKGSAKKGSEIGATVE